MKKLLIVFFFLTALAATATAARSRESAADGMEPGTLGPTRFVPTAEPVTVIPPSPRAKMSGRHEVINGDGELCSAMIAAIPSTMVPPLPLWLSMPGKFLPPKHPGGHSRLRPPSDNQGTARYKMPDGDSGYLGPLNRSMEEYIPPYDGPMGMSGYTAYPEWK